VNEPRKRLVEEQVAIDSYLTEIESLRNENKDMKKLV